MSVLNKGIGEKYRKVYPFALALIGGVVVLSFIWSTFIPYLMKFYGINAKAPFALGASVLGFCNMLIAPPIAGYILDKWGPKATLLVSSLSLVLGAASMNHMISITVWDSASIWWYIGSGFYGLAAGFFAGTHVSTSSKWNPDRLGMASGVANIGPAIGALWMSILCAKLIPTIGIGGTFTVFSTIAIIFTVIIGIIPLRLPDKGWKPAGWNPPSLKADAAGGMSVTLNEATKTGRYWVLWACTFISGLAGFTFAMNIATLVIEGCATVGGMDPKYVLATIVTLVVSATAIVNAVARPCWGVVLDKMGNCWKTLLCVYTGFCITLFLFRFLYTGATSVVIGACLVYLFFGGTAVVHMGCTTTLFGSENAGKILGSTQIATGIAWAIGPYFGAWVADTTGSYAGALYTAAICCLGCAVIACVMMVKSKKVAAE